MSVAIVTGSAGLIGSEAVRRFAAEGLDVIGIDNDLRRYFFGDQASTAWNRRRLERELPGYLHVDADIRDEREMERVFARHGREIAAVVHTAAQPSHDWAAREPRTDFTVNAVGTLNLLELTRKHAPDSVFLFTSTNKVYGDRPNQLPVVELETRFEVAPDHQYARQGIDESMSIDTCLHSLFGASKLAADVLVQEYGRYFGMQTACFRGGCLTGPGHSGTELHGFLAYLVKCALEGTAYTVYGYKGKQVRDNIDASDFVEALWRFFRSPRSGEVYNLGGGRASNCSMLEAITIAERSVGRPLRWSYDDRSRIGDHIWWISDTSRFESHHPGWRIRRTVVEIVDEIHLALRERRDAANG